MTSTILISGANRGIGLELARQFAADGWTVLGTARSPARAGALREAGAEVLPLEATDPASIAALSATLAARPLDVVIANAGIAVNLEATAAAVTRADFLATVRTNTIASFAFATALKPNLIASRRRVVAAMSSLMSSVGANDWGTQFAYRASKTALNASWRALAAEWAPEGITCFLLRPGMVATDMTAGKGIDAAVSVAGMKRVIEGLTPADAGRIIGYDGRDVPW
jgi:NAD(P)-dependent dehydrogenase (short-subunit alcohol dehydrogenase family)